ncbi:MAG: hypothetical protein GQ578_09125 [Desulfuromonadaceae bacterium]|nr:hypothetical protein [Desulfuromonadaceae bacterium]
MKFIVKLTLGLFLLLPFTAVAEIPKEMEADFSSASGYIIMPIGDEYLVDLDATAGLQEGDLLTLVMPGEKVVHPVTKEILGTLDLPKGFLRVTRIKSGYSYAKLLYSDTPPAKGDRIKRFEQVPTTFTATPANEKLLADLKTGLPQLDWLENKSSAQPILIFSLKNNNLTVKNSSGTTLRTYRMVDGQLIAPQPATTYRPTVFTTTGEPGGKKKGLNKVVNNLINSIGFGKSRDMVGGPGIIRNQQALHNQGIWMSANLQGSPVGITVADFDKDGRLETAVAFENQLIISQIEQGDMVEEARIDLPTGISVLSIESIDLDNTGGAEIYLTAAIDHKLKSLSIDYVGGDYQIINKNLPWFLRIVELPGKGKVLIGQRTGDNDRPFYGSPFQILKKGETLQEGDALELPLHVTLFSFLPGVGENNQQVIAYLTQGDYLRAVSTAGNELWESEDYFGGTESIYYNTVENDKKGIVNPIYIQKRILRGPSGEILVAQNDGSRTLERFRMFRDSRVIALAWNGFALQESWRTSGLNGYLADFTLADADNDGSDELVMVVKFKHKTILNPARSTVVIYELNE